MYIYVNKYFFISQHFVEEDFYAYVHERLFVQFWNQSDTGLAK